MNRERSAELYARLDATLRGEARNVLGELRTGFAVLSDVQSLPGHCVLLYRHRVEHLDDLADHDRIAFLLDLSLLGEAVRIAAAAHDPAFSRINYEILGNNWPHLHGHVHARYEWEPEEYRHDPVWCYPNRNLAAHRRDFRLDSFRLAITNALNAATRRAYGDEELMGFVELR